MPYNEPSLHLAQRMRSIPVQRVRIWSTALRTSHWLMAVCALALLLSGWMPRGETVAVSGSWRDVHLTAGYVLAAVLLFRIALLFVGRTPTERWRDCLPLHRRQWLGMRDMLLFYISLGRAPLPAYYGHNPLWGPVYLFLFLVLSFGITTGVLITGHDPQALLQMAATPWWLGWTLPEWHAGLARVIGGFAAAHVLSVFLHDARGTASEISAMVNGHKVFIPPRLPQDSTTHDQVASVKFVKKSS
jgi:Ni/Fe-hydrogenase 1 B-type cytochrome subunit